MYAIRSYYDNILINKEGIAKVTDFGIARAVSSATITMAGSTIGSVHYFSPEQARGGFTDEKSDLYSLGITVITSYSIHYTKLYDLHNQTTYGFILKIYRDHM